MHFADEDQHAHTLVRIVPTAADIWAQTQIQNRAISIWNVNKACWYPHSGTDDTAIGVTKASRPLKMWLRPQKIHKSKLKIRIIRIEIWEHFMAILQKTRSIFTSLFVEILSRIHGL